MTRVCRSKGRADQLLDKLAKGGVAVRVSKASDGKWGLTFPAPDQHTPEQRDLAVEAVLFGIAWARAFGMMVAALLDKGEVA